jgi:hypothetical protein
MRLLLAAARLALTLAAVAQAALLGVGLSHKILALLAQVRLQAVAATLGLEVLSQGAAQQQIQPQQSAQVLQAETTLVQQTIGEPLVAVVVPQIQMAI